MKKFRLMKCGKKFHYRDRYKMVAGCTIMEDSNPETIKEFDSKEEALDVLRKYKTSIADMSSGYIYEECFVEEVEFDDDGDEISWDYIEFTQPTFIVVEKPSYEEMKSFERFKDAEDYMFNITEEYPQHEYYITF